MATLEDVIRENNALRKANRRLVEEITFVRDLSQRNQRSFYAATQRAEGYKLEILRLRQALAKAKGEPLPPSWDETL